MPAILYTCPVTGDRVSGWIPANPERDDEHFEAIECIACRRIHLIDPKTGKTIRAAALSTCEYASPKRKSPGIRAGAS